MAERIKKPKAQLVTDDWMSVASAAKALGKSRHGVLALSIRGALVSQIAAGRTVISRESVEKLREQLQGAA